MAEPRQLASVWAELALEALAVSGVSDVVLCPGSRSAPLALALARTAGLRSWTIVDERSAAFFALGQAKVTGRPSVVVCTSGTAGAHFYPAVLEAFYSRNPLIVITADRPPELQACGAPQTLDQRHLFGAHVRLALDLGPPSPAPASLRAVRRAMVQAVLASTHPEPGPVHVNLPFREPLVAPIEWYASGIEPRGTGSEQSLRPEEHQLDELVAELRREPVTATAAPVQVVDDEALKLLARRLLAAQRGVLVCGPGPLAQRGLAPLVERLAMALGFPIVAEAPSQLRFGRAGGSTGPVYVDQLELLARTSWQRRVGAPDVVFQLGGLATGKGAARLLERRSGASPSLGESVQAELTPSEPTYLVLAAHGWSDPTGRASQLAVGALEPALRRLDALVSATPGAVDLQLTADKGLHGPEDERARARGDGRSHARQEWLERWRAAQGTAASVVRTVMADAEGSSQAMREGGAVQTILDALPPQSLLALGNSLPIRVVDQLCSAVPGDVAVWSQRGVNGIDGLVSGAAGAATAYARGPTCLLLGDVSLLHDVGSLAVARRAARPFAVVVINNGGGRIFDQLPVAATAATTPEAHHSFERDFLTPPELDCAALAQGFGLRFARATTAAGLTRALRDALTLRGALTDGKDSWDPSSCGLATLIEAVVEPGSARDDLAAAVAAIEARLAEWTVGSGVPVASGVAGACVSAPAPSAAPTPTARPREAHWARVALHGFAGAPAMWLRVVAHADLLAPGVKTRCPSLPWHGGPTPLGRPDGFVDAVDLLAAQLGAQTRAPIHLVGYSLGARLALGLLVRHPRLFAAATLIGVHPSLRGDTERAQRRAADQSWIERLRLPNGVADNPMASRARLGAFLHEWQAQPLFATQRELPRQQQDEQERWRDGLDADALALSLERLGLAEMPNYWDALGALSLPVQLVVGERDEKFVALARDAVGRMPHGRLQLVPSAGHNVPLERPEALAQLLVAFERETISSR